VGGSDETCMLMFGNQGQHALCQYAIALTGRGTIHASGLYLSLHPDGHGGFLPDPFDAAVTGGTGDFPGAGGVIHITELDHQHRIYAISLR
ncbi:MAG: hypothetical protein M3N98_12235, partial [Actinomycetota bacterium]|nr:hypothetical protein [Actinomycetota bacterium]